MPTKQTEVEVTKDIVSFLQDRGWIADRTQVGLFHLRNGKPIHIGKVSQPDWRFKRPPADYIEVEMKATGKQPTPHQSEYLATMKAMGFDNHTWADSLEMFMEWYFERFL